MLGRNHIKQLGGGMGRNALVVAEIMNDIRRVFQVVNEQSKKAKCETGLTGPQLWAIKMIGELSPVKVSDLAARMYLHPATVVGILNRLELQGLINRMRTNEDRRVVKVELTDESNAILAKAPQVAQGLLVAGLEVLPLKKLLDIAAALEELVRILGAQELPPRLILSSEINLNKRTTIKKTLDTPTHSK
jgi:MarR family transcriptional regulator, organic hydroperoxide resistance regulator